MTDEVKGLVRVLLWNRFSWTRRLTYEGGGVGGAGRSRDRRHARLADGLAIMISVYGADARTVQQALGAFNFAWETA